MIYKLKYSQAAQAAIAAYGEMCPAMARAEMERCKLNFDDIESINNQFKNHRWGSNADRAYRKRAINKAIKAVCANPLQYGTFEEVEKI